ncbi:MAG: orotidine-5'-phosphate decarboxylase [Candidatus Limnocylindrales bacterium]
MNGHPGTGTTYLERLAARSVATGSVLCLGLDPDPAALPRGFSPDLRGVEQFANLVLDAALPFAAAVKPNLSFYEAFGSAGIAMLERLRARIPPDVPVIGDGKRGDIDSTSARQSVAYFDGLGFDAVTINGYVGEEAIATYLDRPDRFAYVLCRTSNPGAAEIQGLRVRARWDGEGAMTGPDEPLWARMARNVAAWGPGGTVGLVVGATAPEELHAARSIAPGLAFLVPGVGAQGGSIEPVLAAGPATAAPAGGRPGGGLVVNVSRGIAGAALAEPGPGVSADLRERLSEVARSWSAKLPVLP